MLIVTISLAAAFSIHMLFLNFNYNCPMGAQLTFNETCTTTTSAAAAALQELPSEEEAAAAACAGITTSSINVGHSSWGEATACNYMTFVPIMQAIFACIWFVLFAMCGHGGRGMDS